MTTCYTYFYLDTRSKTTEKFPVKIAISHKSKTACIPTGYYLTPEQLEPEASRIGFAKADTIEVAGLFTQKVFSA